MNVTVHGHTQASPHRHLRRRDATPSCSSSNACCRTSSRSSPRAISAKPPRAIRDMVVRGAGAIGATAAYGLAQGARAFRGRDLRAFRRHVDTVYQTLKDRPAHRRRPGQRHERGPRRHARRRDRRGTTGARAGRRRGIRQRRRAPLRGHRPARREADPQRHARAHPLQRRLAGLRGYRQRHRAASMPPRRRAGSSTSSATKPARAPRAPPSPPGNWPSRASPTRSSPTTPPAT